VTSAVTLEWNKREVLKNGTLTLEKSRITLEKVRENAVLLEKVLFMLCITMKRICPHPVEWSVDFLLHKLHQAHFV
jgi:hypothetical protein